MRSALGALEEMRLGRTDPVELMQGCLDAVAAADGVLGAFVALNPSARAEAERAALDLRRDGPRGLLHGLPVAVKDNYVTAGMPTTAGTVASGFDFPDEDAGPVARLRAAGAVIVGKTRMHEFAWGTVTPPTRNPWDPSRVPGGSSGGSAAAIASSMCFGALGSDTGGSIRIPASLCGVVGLKPTFGRVGRHGVVPHSWSLDHAGPLAPTVGDAALLLSVLSGRDPRDPGSAPEAVPDFSAGLDDGVAGLRVGVCRNHFFGRNQPDIQAAVEAAITFFAAAGAEVVEFEMPNLAYGLGAIFAIELASSTAWHDRPLQDGRAEQYSSDVRLLVEMGRLVTGPDYLKAEQFRRLLVADMRGAFERVDVMLSPATPLTAWRCGEWTVEVGGTPEGVLAASWRLSYPFNLAGLPAISLPCGLDRLGLPIGLQIAGRPLEEATVLRAARTYERSHDWAAMTPLPLPAPGGA